MGTVDAGDAAATIWTARRAGRLLDPREVLGDITMDDAYRVQGVLTARRILLSLSATDTEQAIVEMLEYLPTDDIVRLLSRAGTMTRPAIRARRVEIATRNRPRRRRPKAGNFFPATERAAKACQPPDSRWPAKR